MFSGNFINYYLWALPVTPLMEHTMTTALNCESVQTNYLMTHLKEPHSTQAQKIPGTPGKFNTFITKNGRI